MNSNASLASEGVKKRVLIGITGASGAIYGIRTLEICHAMSEIEVHLIVSKGARSTIGAETGRSPRDLSELADFVHSDHDLGASVSSGSFLTHGMIVAPCSIKTLSTIANSHNETLISRAADVTLKEGRRLVLMVRETPLHKGHLRLMSLAAESGAIIYPPVPSFYTMPKTLDDLVTHTCQRALEQLGVYAPDTKRWDGIRGDNSPSAGQ